jgi:hypothetical protein
MARSRPRRACSPEMTPREQKRREGYLRHEHQRALELWAAKQARQQTGAQEKWNRAITTCGADDEVIMLDNLSADELEQAAD